MRTETDLRAALESMADDAPRVDDVMPVRRAPRVVGWAAPVIAALVVVAVAVSLAARSSRDDVAGGNVARLVGIDWRLRTADGAAMPNDAYTLRVEPNGRFRQLVAYCTTVYGSARLTDTMIDVTSVATDFGTCPVDHPMQSVESPARHLFAGTLTWRVADDRLVLTNGDTMFVYVRAAHSAAQSRQWTYRGIGVTVPAQWASSTSCRSPLRDVIAATCVMSPDDSVTVEFTAFSYGHPTVTRIAGLPSIMAIDGVEATVRLTPPRGADYRGQQMLELDFPVQGVTLTVVGASRDTVANELQQVFVVGG